MSETKIIINGGTNTIVPNATTIEQHFYGDQFAEKILFRNTQEVTLTPEQEKLAIYINKVNIPEFLSMIEKCETATELARVIVEMCDTEDKLTKDIIVKERFITHILPFATRLTKGTSVDNIRQRINDALARRTKRHTQRSSTEKY